MQAAAAKAVAEWEAAKAAAHGSRFNPNHGAAGSGVGGQFVSASGGGGGKAAASKKPAAAKAKPAASGKLTPKRGPDSAKTRLMQRAAGLRQQAHQLEEELHTLEAQLQQQQKAAASSAKQAHQAAKTAKGQAAQKHKQAAQAAKQKAAAKKAGHISNRPHHHAGHRHPHHAAKHTASLRQRIAALKVKIATLRAQARQLERQAAGMRALAAATELRSAERSAGMAHAEFRAQMGAADINDLPDSAFAYIEPGGTRDSSGRTAPRSLRHFPIHDKAHADNAAARIAQGAKFGKEALPKVKAAQKKFGESDSGGGRSVLFDEEVRELRITSQYKDLDSRLELRSDGDGAQWIGGYASVFMPRESRNLGGFIERVAPEAFNEARASGWQDVVCRFNHNSDYVLGTAAAGTLQLRTDGVGLDYEVLPPVAEERIRELVERGDIRYSSFAFRVPQGGDEWGVTDQNFPMRTLHDVELVDVAPVLSPAYPDATAAVRATSPALRSLAAHMQIAVDEVRALADADELRRLFIRTDRPMYKKETPRLFGPQAATLLLGRREDPYVDEG